MLSRIFRAYSTTTNYNLIAASGLKHVAPTKILFQDHQNEVTYGQFLEKAGKFAHLLHSKYSIQKGDRVLARTTKSIDIVALYIACLQLGAIYVPVNPTYTSRETAHFIQDAEPKMFVTCNEAFDQQFRRTVETVIDEGKLVCKSHGVSSASDIETIQSSEIACICYTSGTTGLPKGAMLTHGSLTANAKALIHMWRFTETDNRLLAEHSFCREIVSNMRLFVSGSAPLSLATFEEFEQRTGHRILERYGMTEAQVICSNLYEIEGRVAGSVGVRLERTELRLNESEGIEIKSASVFGGYWRNPEKTKQNFTEDGFFKTGDVGQVDANGFVRIMGRSKDLIISGGFNVYPKELEDVIDKLVGVKECAVIGVPHNDLGEAVVAVIVTEARIDIGFFEQSVISQIKTQVAYYKVPKKVVFVDALPRNSMAKIQKLELRKQYSNLFR